MSLSGRGKTTLLRILADFIPDSDRIVVIEDTSELHIQKPNIVPAECCHSLMLRMQPPPLLTSLPVVSLRGRPLLCFYGEDPAATIQRIVELETAIEPRYLAWLAHENAAGANVYVAANPLRSDSRKRTKECIASVRHLYLDLDTDGEARLTSLRVSDAVPPPNAVLSTSLGKYQILWRVDGFTLEQQESALKLLTIAFGGDRACTDCNRVLRLPGFVNCKYDPACRVTVEYPGDSTWNSDDFRLDILAADAILSSRAITPRKHSSNHTTSEHDWAWILHELARGKDATKLTRKLASRRADKPNPLYYARRTIDVASARLWLIEGIPIDDVVTPLEVRRRFEIPVALCRARAREIAQTAQRMIARRKIA